MTTKNKSMNRQSPINWVEQQSISKDLFVNRVGYVGLCFDCLLLCMLFTRSSKLSSCLVLHLFHCNLDASRHRAGGWWC